MKIKYLSISRYPMRNIAFMRFAFAKKYKALLPSAIRSEPEHQSGGAAFEPCRPIPCTCTASWPICRVSYNTLNSNYNKLNDNYSNSSTKVSQLSSDLQKSEQRLKEVEEALKKRDAATNALKDKLQAACLVSRTAD